MWLKLVGSPDSTPPRYATDGSAGMDVCSIEDHYILPGQRALVDTGLVALTPDGFELQVRPRSGLALKHGVTVLNAPGTIDSDYRGRIKVILINHGEYPFTVSRGDRIAQLVLSPVIQARVNWDYEHPAFEFEETSRGSGGFGSTGV